MPSENEDVKENDNFLTRKQKRSLQEILRKRVNLNFVVKNVRILSLERIALIDM